MRCAVLLLFGATGVFAQTPWLTVIGDEGDPSSNVVQVDPVPVAAEADGVSTKMLRVNRAVQRTSWDGIPYRSYVARVRFDCKAATAQYLSIEYHAQPLWAGAKTKPVDYTTGPARMMLFMDMQPNPRATIVRAACSRRAAPPQKR